MDVIHTALWVSDIDRTRSFYVDALGLEENWSFESDGVQNVYIGGEHGEFQFKHDPEGVPESNASGGSSGSEQGERTDGGPEVDSGTMAHVAVGVDSVDETFERLVERADPPVRTAPTTVDDIDRRIAFVEDPDGYVVELVERLD